MPPKSPRGATDQTQQNAARQTQAREQTCQQQQQQQQQQQETGREADQQRPAQTPAGNLGEGRAPLLPEEQFEAYHSDLVRRIDLLSSGKTDYS